MAELSVVYGGGDNGISQASGFNGFGAGGGMNNNNGNNNGGMMDNGMYVQPTNRGTPSPAMPALNLDNNNVGDGDLNKLRTAVEKQKKLKELKEELQNFNKESILDSYIKKKKDMVRIFLFALIVLLGLSLHDVVKVYLNKYVMNNELSYKTEMYIRLSVPLTIYFVIWTTKAFTKTTSGTV